MGQTSQKPEKTLSETALFGAGCFWGVEAAFRQLAGVRDVAVGYSGGTFVNPTYQDVCSGSTGHAEVVQVEYDPEKISYSKLLEVFWASHNPTTLNRQGPDIGTQYHSAIFYYTPRQQTEAEASKASLGASGAYKAPVITEILPAGPFYRAEEYHQRYLEKRGQSSCHL
jgi:peptide-methionine (S)-S-oxide reductase